MFAFVGWAASVTDDFLFYQSVPVVGIFLSGTSFFIWYDTFFALTRFMHADASIFKLVIVPDVFLISVTFEVVDLWTIASSTFSSVAASIEVINSDFITEFAIFKFFFGSDTNSTRFVFWGRPT